MPLVLADRVRETTTTTGTGTISLAGPVSGFQGFSTAIGNANTTYYTIVDAATGAWEVGLGTYTSAGSTLARTTVLSSSNSDALVSFGAGTKDVFVTQPAERAVYVLGAGTGLAAGAAAFTSGGVPYADSTSTLATGSALTFDGTNLLVGGTSVYSATMTSYATASRSGGLGIRNSAGTAAGGIYTGAAGSGGGSTDVYVEGVGLLGFITGGSEQMRLTSTGLGIGTSSPTVKLDITGNDRLIRLNATSNNALMRYSQSGTAKFSQGLNDPVGWILFDDVASAYRLVVDYSGNLGIGTSSPGAQLDISTTVSATGAILRLSNQSNAISVDQPHGTIQFFSGDDSSPADTVVSSIISAQATTAPNEGYLKFLTGNNTEKLRIDAAGNLGLGVTPSAWGGAGLPAFQRGSSSFFEYGYNNTIVGSNYYFDGTNNRYFSNGFASYYQQFSGGHAWNTAASGTAGNAITFTQAMTLNASGLLGVGTTSPQNRIDTRDDINYPLSWGSTSAAVGFLSQATGATVIGALSTNALAFYTNAAERMRLDSSGNLGLGVTPSAWDAARKAIQISSTGALVSSSLNTLLGDNWYVDVSADKYLTTGAATLYQLTGGSHRWYNAPSGTAGNAITFTQAMTLDADGDLGIGTTSPATKLHVNSAAIDEVARFEGTGDPYISVYDSGTRQLYFGSVGASDIDFWVETNKNLRFATNNTERARITSGGYFKASNAGTYLGSTGDYHELRSSNDNYLLYAVNTRNGGNGPFGISVEYSAQDPNGTGNEFLQCVGISTLRAEIRSNGGLANYQSNNVDLSDARTKTDINPLGSYWSKIAGLEIVTYKYKDQTHDDLNIGVIAQQVEQVAPEFVDTDGFGDTPEDGVPLKTIYNKDLTFAAIKALQEAMARIETLEAELAALKGA